MGLRYMMNKGVNISRLLVSTASCLCDCNRLRHFASSIATVESRSERHARDAGPKSSHHIHRCDARFRRRLYVYLATMRYLGNRWYRLDRRPTPAVIYPREAHMCRRLAMRSMYRAHSPRLFNGIPELGTACLLFQPCRLVTTVPAPIGVT